MSTLHWWTLGGVGIILVLAMVALYYVVLLIRSNKEQQKQRALQQLEREQQRGRTVRSIHFIARGMLDGQLTLTEGSIRIGVLLDSLIDTERARTEFRAIYLLAEATSHIPILDAWKQLNTREKLGFDKQREQLETDHREFVLDAARRLLEAELG